MTVSALDAALPQRRAGPWTIVRLGLRELRNGFDGFRIFIACLALGVMVIAAVGALADALRAGLVTQGEVILGGDVMFARAHVRATPAEREVFERLGQVSETATLRTMARRVDGSDQALAELKGADSAYPLAGEVTLKSSGSFAQAIAGDGAVADAMLLERLGLKVGDKMRIGETEVTVGGILDSEPDAVADRMTYGPRIFVSLATLEKTGLDKPGTLIRWRYVVDLPDTAASSKQALADLRAQVARELPDGGFSSGDRFDPSPQITRVLERLRQFLILIGLASLLVGGVGIANAVSTFIDKRMKVIATLRSVGASGSQIMGIFLVQLAVMTAIGIAIGLALGVAAPSLIDALYGDLLPVRVDIEVSPQSLGIAALYGALISLLFALWPLGRAENVKASVLFRDSVNSPGGRPRPMLIGIMAALAALLVGVAVATSEPRSIALWVIAGLVVMLAVFGWLGGYLSRLAGRLPRPKRPGLALALRNIASPDGLTRSVLLSLGTGLSLLVAVGLANSSLVADLQERLPEEAPDYFLLDIPPADFDGLKDRMLQHVPGASLVEAPMLRGRIVALKGKPVEEMTFTPDTQWVMNSDRGLTYSETVPEGSTVSAGTWWAKDYNGPPLVSFEGEIAKKLGLGLGDSLTVNVLGRNIEAKVASLRDVKWESIALNFIMVFSPNTLKAAPHNLLATVRLPPGRASGAESEMVRDLGRVYPSVSAIRVRDAIDQFSKIFAKVMVAVQVAGSVTLTAGALVLAGALVTAQRRRILEAVILKTIGARRRQILEVHAWEYALLALIAALVAIVLGSAVAWVAVTRVMELEYVFSLRSVGFSLGVAAAMIAVFGGCGTWAILRARPAPYLRSE
ncbi:ABC transporter permease [Hyphomicrobium sp.]|uniref:ABC transporter permease n=1 Tax=Hyphomicrobium sp. TaxID=82 RepID=UPI002D77122C|nr:FtsX-like permease family protein [Hyphomicrobium sp.]HET6388773.1 FtsX-like permease family protein [Hyphomicrobium sp.]